MKKNGYILLLVIITLVVLITSVVMNYTNKEEEKNDISIVTNYTNFYTVDNCANRYVTSITMGDSDSLLKQLSSSYKKENNVNKDNVLNIIGSIDATSYKSNKMYYEAINENVTKYYVDGSLVKEEFDEYMNIVSNTSKEYYLIIYLNKKNDTFSVEPYDGEIFIEGDIDGQ